MLIVDGHNLIGRSGSLRLSDEARSREELLRRIAARKGAGGEAVVVVFDGTRPETRGAEKFGGVRVLYSSAGRTADEEIIRRVDAGNPREITVVTSDRELADRVRARGARVLGSEAFWGKLTQAVSPDASDPAKPAPSPDDAEHWLKMFQAAKPARKHKM
jgi:predicted RNA-binding protein with PIN domain